MELAMMGGCPTKGERAGSEAFEFIWKRGRPKAGGG